MLVLPCTSHFCALQHTPLAQALSPHCTPQEAPWQVTGAGQALPPLHATVVSPEASLSTPLPQLLSALHWMSHVPEPCAQSTLPEQAPRVLQWIWHFWALHSICVLHEPSAAHSMVHWLPPQRKPLRQLDMLPQLMSQLEACVQSIPLAHDAMPPHSTRQAAPAGHLTSF